MDLPEHNSLPQNHVFISYWKGMSSGADLKQNVLIQNNITADRCVVRRRGFVCNNFFVFLDIHVHAIN